MGLIITDELKNDESELEFLNKYRREEFDSELGLDIYNRDSIFDYFFIGDMREQQYIINKNGDKVNSAIISNIDLKKCIKNLANNLYCIVDKYHWYDFENLKNDLCINDNTKALKEIISSIKDKNKVLTIVTFHI